MLSRRHLLQCTLAGLGPSAHAALNKVSEARGLEVLAVSPYNLIALTIPANSDILSFRPKAGFLFPPATVTGSLSVRELPSLREIRRIQLPGIIQSADFYGVPDQAIVTTFAPRSTGISNYNLSTSTGNLNNPKDVAHSLGLHHYAGQSTPIVSRRLESGNEPESWSVVRDGQILEQPWRPPSVPQPKYNTRAWLPKFSLDRSQFVHAVGEFIVFRDAGLNPVWTWENTSRLEIWQVAISGDGSKVAVAMVDPNHLGMARRNPLLPPRIVILDSSDGSKIGELTEDGSGALALSPDGSKLAIGVRQRAPQREDLWDLSARVISLTSSDQPVDLPHVRVSDFKTSLVTFFGRSGVEFTFDGRYLVISAQCTKVWEL